MCTIVMVEFILPRDRKFMLRDKNIDLHNILICRTSFKCLQHIPLSLRQATIYRLYRQNHVLCLIMNIA